MVTKYGDLATSAREQQIGRRQFMVGAGATAMSFTVIRPALVVAPTRILKLDLG